MPSLKALRKRIATVRSTQKITKAMKMVAAARLRRAQEVAEHARPYAAALAEMFSAVAAGIDPETHPLLARREERRVDLLTFTSDRGLCGGYNASILRQAEAFRRARASAQSALGVLGRKGIEYFRRRGAPVLLHRTGILGAPAPELARELGDGVIRRFVEQETDAVYLLYSRFHSAISQVPTVVRVLPVSLPPQEGPSAGYIFEPARPELLDLLLPRYIQALITQALLEAEASEHGARMTAMDNATTNATEMIDRLTLSMNRVRQAAITTELMEIVSGAEALRG